MFLWPDKAKLSDRLMAICTTVDELVRQLLRHLLTDPSPDREFIDPLFIAQARKTSEQSGRRRSADHVRWIFLFCLGARPPTHYGFRLTNDHPGFSIAE